MKDFNKKVTWEKYRPKSPDAVSCPDIYLYRFYPERTFINKITQFDWIWLK